MPDHYCTTSDLESRLTGAGLKRAADREDFDGDANPVEMAAYIDPAIEAADTEIDAAIHMRYDPATARGNAWLKWIAIRLAAVEALTIGGRTDASPAMVEDRDISRKQLEQVRMGQISIYGLVEILPSDVTETDLENQRSIVIAELAEDPGTVEVCW